MHIRFERFVLAPLVVAIIGAHAFAGSGDLDATFGGRNITTAIGPSNDVANAVAIQADGKIVVAGYALINAVSSNDFALARYLTNGVLDTSFGTNNDGKVITPIGSSNNTANAVAIQSDGKIVVAGSAHNGADYDFALARYLTNGVLDTGFGTDGKVVTHISGQDYGLSVAIQSDGKIVVAGYAWNAVTSNDFVVVRYLTNGVLDAGFGTNSDGIVATDVGGQKSQDYGKSVAIDSNGMIVVAGYSYISGYADFTVARYTTNGILDTGFSGDGKVATGIGSGDDIGNSVAIQSDGKIVVAGTTRLYGVPSWWEFSLTRYTTNGALDTGFSGDGKLTTRIGSTNGSSSSGYSVAIQSDGKIVVAGTTANLYENDFALARYTTNGTLDAGFGVDGRAPVGWGNDRGTATAIQPDGKIVLAGYSTTCFNDDFALAFYNSDGSFGFERDGKVITPFYTGYNGNDYAYGVEQQSDGKIVAAGYCNTTYADFALARYRSNGDLDTGFGGDGRVVTPIFSGTDAAFALAIQSNSNIVAAGYTRAYAAPDWYPYALARYATNGGLDTGFSGDGKLTTLLATNDTVRSAAIQSDGKIVVAGYSSNILPGGGGSYFFSVARYLTNGVLDTSFSDDGWITNAVGSGGQDYAIDVAIQSDGKIVVAGYGKVGATNQFALARYTTNGVLDTDFSGDGKLTTAMGGNDYGQSVAIQPDGKIVVAGYTIVGATNDFAVARYNSDGTLDTGFSGDGKLTTAIGSSNDVATAVAIQSDGKIVVSGSAFNGAYNDFAVARYRSNGSLDTGFGGGDGMVTSNFGGNAAGYNAMLQSDGKIVVVGIYWNGANWDFALARYENLIGLFGTLFSIH